MKIQNEFGEVINSIFPFNFIEYTQPYLLVDTLAEKEKTPDIRRDSDMNILTEIDFVLYMKLITRKNAWLRWQKFILFLKPAEDTKEPGYKKLNKLPPNHEFEVDNANCKVRIVGPFTTKYGFSDWVYY